jgi:hypothetical protein
MNLLRTLIEYQSHVPMNTDTSNTTIVPTTPVHLVRSYALCANCSNGNPCDWIHPVPPPGAPHRSRRLRSPPLDDHIVPRILFPEVPVPGAPRRPRRTHSQPLHNAENVSRRLDFSGDEIPTDIDDE